MYRQKSRKVKGGADAYRYGFNGKEKDADGEWGGITHYDYGFRIYNPAIGKFLSVDPLTSSYLMLTPYQYASNSPIGNIDIDGLEGTDVTDYRKNLTVSPGTRVILSPKKEVISPPGIPQPICCDESHVQIHDVTIVHPGGLSGGPAIPVFNESTRIEVVDDFTPALLQWNLQKGQNDLAESNLNMATLFAPGPAIFKSGKFLKSFLTNSKFQNVIAGFPKVSLKGAQSGFNFKNSNRIDEFNNSIQKIQNLANKHFEADDLEGAINEIHGFSSNGQHLTKVQDGIRGLKNQINFLTKQLDNGDLFEEAKAAANGAIKTAKDAVRLGEDVIKAAEQSAKSYK